MTHALCNQCFFFFFVFSLASTRLLYFVRPFYFSEVDFPSYFGHLLAHSIRDNPIVDPVMCRYTSFGARWVSSTRAVSEVVLETTNGKLSRQLFYRGPKIPRQKWRERPWSTESATCCSYPLVTSPNVVDIFNCLLLINVIFSLFYDVVFGYDVLSRNLLLNKSYTRSFFCDVIIRTLAI